MMPCNCGSGKGSWVECDGRGIEIARVCPSCRDERLKPYRKDIFTHYDQSDVDCRIEPED